MPDDDVPPWGPAGAPIAIVIGLALGLVATILVQLAGDAGGGSLAHPSPIVTLLASVAFDLSFVIAALYVANTRGRVRPRDFGYRLAPIGAAATTAVLAAVVYYGLSAVYANLLGLKGEKLPRELGFGTSTPSLVAAGVFVCVLAPLMEEFFFRGFLFGALRRLPLGRASIPTATVLVGILFGLAHLGSAPARYLVPLGLFGAVLCVVRWRTRSLYPCMVLHSVNNSLALGVNQLHWSVGEVVALCVAGVAAVSLLTGPLARAPTAA